MASESGTGVTEAAVLDWNYPPTYSRPLRWFYDYYIGGSTLPPQEQWIRHYNAGKAVYTAEGYNEQEIKWWFLRTGQGPKCFEQYGVGGPCGLPPYEVWRGWYFKPYVSPYGSGLFGDNFVRTLNMYPPPGYSMPGVPCNTTGKFIGPTHVTTGSTSPAWYQWLAGGPWPYPDLPEMSGDPFVWPVSKEAGWEGLGTEVIGVYGGSLAFCNDGTEGKLHATPLAFLVFLPNKAKLQKQIRGLPIAVMAMLDKYTNKQWWPYFDAQVRNYLSGASGYMGILQAWPWALRDTLNNFGVTDAGLWSLQSKFEETQNKFWQSQQKQKGMTILMGGGVGEVVTMAVISFITWGVASAAGALIAEALEGVAVGGLEVAEIQQYAKTAQTVYNLGKQITSDDPNLLSIASGLLSLSGQLDLGGVEPGYDAGDWEPVTVGGDQLTWDFDYPGFEFGLESLNLDGATDVISLAMEDSLYDIDLDTSWIEQFDFASIATEDLTSAVDYIVANLDQFSGDPGALFDEIESLASGFTEGLTDDVLATIDDLTSEDFDFSVDSIMADDAALASAFNFGTLDVTALDMSMLSDGWDATISGIGDFFDAATDFGLELMQEAGDLLSELSIDDVKKFVDFANQVQSVFQTSAALPPPPPPKPPPTAPVVTAPAPEQPPPGPVATVTGDVLEPIDAFAPYTGIQTTRAGFGPVAPDGEKGFNWWWLLPLGMLAVPKKSARRVKRKARL
jgi:hypothetical protein